MGELSFSEGQRSAYRVLAGDARHACLFGGARSGKTFLIVRGIIEPARKAPGSRHLIARLRGNAVWTAIAGDQNSTIHTVARLCFANREDVVPLVQHRLDGFFELQNGSTIWLGGLEDEKRLDKILGREYSTIYLNEASELTYSTASMAMTRLAEVKPNIKQRIFVDLNPVGKSHWTHRWFIEKVDPISRLPLGDPDNFASARLNPGDNYHNLDSEFVKSLEELPEKHRKRFLEGVFVDEVEGALWTYENLERCRASLEDIPVALRQRVVVAVDPSGAANKDSDADEIGIIVAAKSKDGHAYVLADYTFRGAPREWAQTAVNAFHEFRADLIVAEGNFGGEMVKQTIKMADPSVPVHLVTASRGKAVRAEPVAELYDLGKVHHVGRFGHLEDQLCAFSSAGYKGADSPDHADALIWAISELFERPPPIRFSPAAMQRFRTQTIAYR